MPERLFVYPQPELLAHRGKNSYIPWWDALLSKNYDLVEVFMGLGIDPEEKCPEHYSIPGLTVGGHAFLELAASKGNFLTPSTYKIGQTLIKLGAKIDAIESYNKTITLVQLAIARGMSLCVQLLLENGAKLAGPEWLSIGSPGFLALHLVNQPAKEIDVPDKINETLRVLFEHDIDPKWRDQKGSNLLHNLVIFFVRPDNLKDGIVEIAKTMVEAGVPLDDADDSGLTPLHFAIHRNDHKLADYLIQKGANVDMKIKHEFLPVELAACRDADKVLDLFLDKEIHHVNDRHYNGYTLLHWACLNAKSRSVSLLLRRGADMSLKNNFGGTPFSLIGLDDAKQKDSIVQMLKEFAKASFENNKVCEEDWKLIREHQTTFETFKSCIKELEEMSSTKFYGSCTYFQVLKMSKSVNKLANLTRNDEFLEKFWASLKLFDYFKEDLEMIFKRATEIRDESLEVYRRIETIFYEFLPEVVLRNLSDHLKIKDLPLTE